MVTSTAVISIFTLHSQNKISSDVKPWQINISAADISDLKNRIAVTRWPDEVSGAGWDYGTNHEYLKELTACWQTNFDWKKQETTLNKFSHFTVTIKGSSIHFIYEKGKRKKSSQLDCCTAGRVHLLK